MNVCVCGGGALRLQACVHTRNISHLTAHTRTHANSRTHAHTQEEKQQQKSDAAWSKKRKKIGKSPEGSYVDQACYERLVSLGYDRCWVIIGKSFVNELSISWIRRTMKSWSAWATTGAG